MVKLSEIVQVSWRKEMFMCSNEYGWLPLCLLVWCDLIGIMELWPIEMYRKVAMHVESGCTKPIQVDRSLRLECFPSKSSSQPTFVETVTGAMITERGSFAENNGKARYLLSWNPKHDSHLWGNKFAQQIFNQERCKSKRTGNLRKSLPCSVAEKLRSSRENIIAEKRKIPFQRFLHMFPPVSRRFVCKSVRKNISQTGWPRAIRYLSAVTSDTIWLARPHACIESAPVCKVEISTFFPDFLLNPFFCSVYKFSPQILKITANWGKTFRMRVSRCVVLQERLRAKREAVVISSVELELLVGTDCFFCPFPRRWFMWALSQAETSAQVQGTKCCRWLMVTIATNKEKAACQISQWQLFPLGRTLDEQTRQESLPLLQAKGSPSLYVRGSTATKFDFLNASTRPCLPLSGQ